jgi:NADP-dependent aldehyde dehydrogenase
MSETRVVAASVEQACASALASAEWMASTSPGERAALLRALADAIDAASDELVPIAREESALPLARLTGEVGRTSGQLRLFAAALIEGSVLEVVFDSALPESTPPRPEVRRMLVPLGPVAVFTASNFPFAFSVLGGDTASALAAGCPVVVKANPGHPRLTEATVRVAQRALAQAGAPVGVLTAVGADLESGVALVTDPRITAVGFTGSTRGGLALARLAAERPEPIPFYGELGSINPVFVTRAAAAARIDEIAAGYVASFTLGSGQFCTKPGLLLVPRSTGIRAALAAAAGGAATAPMLNATIRAAFAGGLAQRLDVDGVEVLHEGGVDDETGLVGPTLLAVPVDLLLREELLREECFGPVSLVVEYDDERSLLDVAAAIPGVLTATIAGNGDEEILADLVPSVRARAGRVLWNGWPTGVAVTWSQQHGGPFPATTSSLHTSVGVSAMRRFQRPVAWQSWPDHLLPPALRSDNPWQLPRRVDGVLEEAES